MRAKPKEPKPMKPAVAFAMVYADGTMLDVAMTKLTLENVWGDLRVTERIVKVRVEQVPR